MPRTWPGYVPPVAAVLITFLVTAVYAVFASLGSSTSVLWGLLLVILMPMPLLLAVVWGNALLLARPRRLVITAAAIWFAATWFLAPEGLAWRLGSYVTAGLVAGVALGRRWRNDVALALIALVLIPAAWTLIQVPVAEQLAVFSDEFVAAQQKSLPAGASPEQAAQVAAEVRQELEKVTRLTERAYPGFLALGILGEAALVLVVVWWLGRRLGLVGLGRKLPAFSCWRLPFYVVWGLIAGIGLLLTRIAPLDTIGLNLALVAGLLLSIQGLSVQVFVINRLLSPVMRLVFWVVMGVFLHPLLMASSLVLGLADQWLELRRAGCPETGQDEEMDTGATDTEDRTAGADEDDDRTSGET